MYVKGLHLLSIADDNTLKFIIEFSDSSLIRLVAPEMISTFPTVGEKSGVKHQAADTLLRLITELDQDPQQNYNHYVFAAIPRFHSTRHMLDNNDIKMENGYFQ